MQRRTAAQPPAPVTRQRSWFRSVPPPVARRTGRSRPALVAALAVAVLVVLAVVATRAPPVAPTHQVSVSAAHSAPPGRVLSYLETISGHAVLAGQHNREPLRRPAQWTEQAHALTGTYPALWGGDFGFNGAVDRPALIAEAAAQWRAGTLVTLMWHMCPPGEGQTCDREHEVHSRLDDATWRELTTDGTPLNQNWKQQLDAVVPLLRELRDQGVEVLWRPAHELNDRWAWWGGRPGPQGSSLLFRMIRDHFDAQGLTNLIWVWSVKDVQPESFAAYWPGDDYVDVVGLDAWMRSFPDQMTYDRLLAVAGRRPLALTEVGTVPTTMQLAGQPRWSYFMVWAEMLVERNSPTLVRHTYADARVLTRDEVSLKSP